MSIMTRIVTTVVAYLLLTAETTASYMNFSDTLGLFREFNLTKSDNQRLKTDKGYLRKLTSIVVPKAKPPKATVHNEPLPPPTSHEMPGSPHDGTSVTTTVNRGEVPPTPRSNSPNSSMKHGLEEAQVPSPRNNQARREYFSRFNNKNKQLMEARQQHGVRYRKEKGIPTAYEKVMEAYERQYGGIFGLRKSGSFNQKPKTQFNKSPDGILARKTKVVPAADDFPFAVIETLPSIRNGTARFHDRAIWEPELQLWRREYLQDYNVRLSEAIKEEVMTKLTSDLLLDTLNREKEILLNYMTSEKGLTTDQIHLWGRLEVETENVKAMIEGARIKVKTIETENIDKVLTKYFGPVPNLH